MKNLLVIAILFGGIGMLSCNSTKKSAVEPVTNSVNQAETNTRQDSPRKGGRRGDGQRGAQFQQELFSKLNLSDQQMEQFKSISEKYRGEMKTLRQNSDGDRSSIRSSMEALYAKQNTELKGIMTESQFELYTQLIEERRKNRGGRGNPRQ